VILSFMEAFHAIWLLVLGMAFLTLIVVLPMRHHELYITLDRQERRSEDEEEDDTARK